MKNSTKFILGGLVLGATAGVTGAAYHVNNTAIPAHIAAQMNAHFNNAYEKHTISGDSVQTTRSGAISVESAGILTYKVTLPAVTVKGKDGSLESTLTVGHTTYDLTFADTGAAITAALRGKGEIAMTMTADKPAEFSSTIGSNEDNPTTINGTCEDVVINATANDKSYQFDTKAEKCTLTGKIEDTHMNATLTSDATFSGSLANDGNDVFSGGSTVRLENAQINAHNTRNATDKLAVGVDSLTVGVQYSALPALSALPQSIDELTLSSMPDGVSFSVQLENLQASASNMPALPSISVSANFGAQGLKAERAAINVGFSYEVGQINDPMVMMMTQGTPDKAACQIDLTDIPMKDIVTLSEKAVDETTGAPVIGPEEILGENGIVNSFEKAGTGVKLNCEAAKAGVFSTRSKAEHKAQDGGFPGEGTIRVEGLDKALTNLSMIFGSDLSGLSEAFTALAVPTEDGKGVKWDYTMDSTGNITINGHKAGIGMPPMMPFIPR